MQEGVVVSIVSPSPQSSTLEGEGYVQLFFFVF